MLFRRALYYYRLLQTGVEEARQVVEEGEREAVVHNFADEDSMQHRDALFEGERLSTSDFIHPNNSAVYVSDFRDHFPFSDDVKHLRVLSLGTSHPVLEKRNPPF